MKTRENARAASPGDALGQTLKHAAGKAFGPALARSLQGGRWGSARSIEARHPARGVMAPVEGGRLHVIQRQRAGVRGDVAVVLLHGASGNACDLSLDLFNALSRRFRVLSFDRPGHGWSDRPGGDRDADPARQAALIAQAIRHLGIRRIILVAHSWSGGLALHLALSRPDLVHGAVLVGAATHPWPGGAISWYHTIASHPRLGDVFAAAAPVGRLLLNSGLRTVFDPQPPPESFVEDTALPLLFRPGQFRANAQDMAGLHSFLTAQAPLYGSLKVPVITLVGDRDRIVPMEHGQALAAQSRKVTLEVAEGVGHMLQHVVPGRIAEAVERIAAMPSEGGRLRSMPADATVG
jgi:pimeloyl-ACP methyl ester carboxylesterase